MGDARLTCVSPMCKDNPLNHHTSTTLYHFLPLPPYIIPPVIVACIPLSLKVTPIGTALLSLLTHQYVGKWNNNNTSPDHREQIYP